MTSISARVVLAASSAARRVGAMLDGIGKNMEVAKYTEKLVPSTRFVAVDGVAPVVSHAASTFVAPSASVIGNVTIGKSSSIWYGATVRGDVNKVTIGDNTNIGDRTVVHVAKIQGDHPTSIGDNVTIGPCALIHAATIHNDCMIGAGAQVMDGAVVESHSILAPGSMVTPKTTVKSGELWAGSPAKKVRALTAEEIATIRDAASDRAELAALHAIECSKDYKQLAADEELYEDMELRDEEHFPRDLQDPSDVQGQGSPGLIFNTTLSNPEEGLKMKQAQGGSK